MPEKLRFRALAPLPNVSELPAGMLKSVPAFPCIVRVLPPAAACSVTAVLLLMISWSIVWVGTLVATELPPLEKYKTSVG